MSIFKRKSKAAKTTEKDNKETADGDKPKPAPYKHRPQHAASDAVTSRSGDADLADRRRIAAQSQARLANGSGTQLPSPNAVWAQSLHGTPLPSPASRSTRSLDLYNQRAGTPRSVLSPVDSNSDMRNGLARAGTGYFGKSSVQAPSFDSPILGNPKMHAAARDRGYVTPHYSGDSGYGSVEPSSGVHSRAPSEQDMPNQVASQPYLPRNQNNFLPELRLSEELSMGPAFSEQALYGNQSDHLRVKRAPEGVLKSSRSYHKQTENGEPRPLTASRSISKQTRFHNSTEADPPMPQNYSAQPPRHISNQQNDEHYPQVGPYDSYHEPQEQTANLASVEQAYQSPPGQQSATVEQTQPVIEEPAPETSAQVDSRFDTNLAQFTSSGRVSTPSAMNQYAEPERSAINYRHSSTPPRRRGREVDQRVVQSVRYPTPPPQSREQPLERVTSIGSQHSVLPNLSILSGLKVNKRGRILDEEGDPIGELYEGDIIDCVRQRANAHGEVLDEYGSVVGRVRTLLRASEAPSSPTPYSQQSQQPFQRQHRHQSVHEIVSPVAAPGQQEQFERLTSQPSRQQLSEPQQLIIHRENLADTPHLYAPKAMPSQHFHQSQNEHVELDASEYSQAPPLMDQSDIFIPPSSSSQTQQSPEIIVPDRAVARPLSLGRRSMDSARPRSQVAEHHFPPELRHVAAARQSQDVANELQANAQQALSPSLFEQVPQWEQQNRRTNPPQLSRAVSDSSMTDTYRGLAKPTMNPVPEDTSLAGNSEKEPGMFSYKGEIPAAEPGLMVPNANLLSPRGPGGRPTTAPAFPRQAIAAGIPGVTAFAPMSSAQFSSAAGGLSPKRNMANFAAGVPGQRPGASSRTSFNSQPLKRSPLSSHETTPPQSEESTSDDGKPLGQHPQVQHPQQPPPHSRHASVKTARSMQSVSSTATATTTNNNTTANGKPRTYFTHGGQVVAPPTPRTFSKPAEAPKPEPAAAEKGKKKGRFSFALRGKKEAAAVAAH